MTFDSAEIDDPLADIRSHWDQHHSVAELRASLPEAAVMNLARTKFLDPRGKRAVDLGCGAGRHALFLAEQGFNTYACDISIAGMRFGLAEACCRRLSIHWEQFDANHTEWGQDFFDLLVSWGVAGYGRRADLIAHISECHRIMKPGAWAIFVLRDVSDFRHGKGLCVEEHVYTLEISETQEHGLTCIFVSGEEVPGLFSAFSYCEHHARVRPRRDSQQFDADWIVTVHK